MPYLKPTRSSDAIVQPSTQSGAGMIAYDEQMLHIRRLGKRLLRSANCIITFGDASLDLRISAGVASTEGFLSAATDELSGRAEVALYAAKEAGRKCVVEVRPI